MKRFVSAIVCGMLTMSLAFTGCSGEKKLTVATNAEFEPFEFFQENEIVGFDIELISAIADKIGTTIELDNMEFDGVIAAVQSGTSDVAISGLTITPKRANSVDFSIPYYTGAAQMIIANADDTMFTGTTKEELDAQLVGKTIGVCAGFTGESYVNGDEDMGFNHIEGAEAVVFDNLSLAITGLKNGSIDAVIMDDSVARKAVSSPENSTVKLIEIPLSVEEYGIAIKKGNTELKESIDKALEELIADGTVDSMLQKWELD